MLILQENMNLHMVEDMSIPCSTTLCGARSTGKRYCGGHLWNPSYCAVMVSDRSREQVERYILTQKDRAQTHGIAGATEGQHGDHIKLQRGDP